MYSMVYCLSVGYALHALVRVSRCVACSGSCLHMACFGSLRHFAAASMVDQCVMKEWKTELYTNIMQGKRIKLRMKDDSLHRWLALRLSRVTPQVVQVREDIRLLAGTGCDRIVRPRVGPAAGCGRGVLVSLKMP